MAKISRTWEKRSPKRQWTTFWIETLNKAFVQVPKYKKIPKKIGTEGGPRGVIIAPGLITEPATIITARDMQQKDKNSSGDEIANVNFLRRYGTYVLQNTKKREPTSFNQLDDS